MLYTNVRIYGCLFHFGQNLFKTWYEFGQKTNYDDETYSSWFTSTYLTYMIPHKDIESVWEGVIT